MLDRLAGCSWPTNPAGGVSGGYGFISCFERAGAVITVVILALRSVELVAGGVAAKFYG